MARITAIWLSFALLYLGAGCVTHVSAVRPLPAEKEAEINGLVAGREAKLTLKDATYDSKDVRVTGDTVRFVGRGPDKPQWLPETEAPLASLQRIEFHDHGRGARRGAVIGAVVGVVIGALGGAWAGAASEAICEGTCGNRIAEGAVILGAVGAAVIGLVGAGIGAAEGATTTIEFTDAPPP